MIYNKREYKAYIRSLFADATAEEFENYEQEIKNSDKRRKTIQKEIGDIIKELKTEPDFDRQQLLQKKLETVRLERSQIVPSV